MVSEKIQTASVHISRNSPRDIRMRDLYLTVDDEEEHVLLFGDSLDIPLEPGDHTIRVSNRVYSRKLDFRIQESESAKFVVGNIPSKGLFSIFMIMSGTVPYKVWIERR